MSIWNRDYLQTLNSEEGSLRAVTLIPNFHKHLVLETVQRMNLNVMQVVLQEELMIANFAFTLKPTNKVPANNIGKKASNVKIPEFINIP